MTWAWPALADAVVARLTGDTGTGGLFDANNELLIAVYRTNAPVNASMPYAVVTSVSTSEEHQKDPTRKIYNLEFDVSIWLPRENYITSGQLELPYTQEMVDAATARVKERLDRWKPTLDDFEENAVFYDTSPVSEEVQGDTIYTVHSFFTTVQESPS